ADSRRHRSHVGLTAGQMVRRSAEPHDHRGRIRSHAHGNRQGSAKEIQLILNESRWLESGIRSLPLRWGRAREGAIHCGFDDYFLTPILTFPRRRGKEKNTATVVCSK